MDLSEWINKNHNQLFNIVCKITRNHSESDELYQHVILQLLEKPEKMNDLTSNQKKYYFIKVIKNNWNSSTSPFQYHRQKFLKSHISYEGHHSKHLLDEEYKEDIPDLEWVYDHLNELDWFERDLFKLWIELGTYTKVSEDTTIPLNSVGKYIKKTINKLREMHKKENGL